MGGRSIAAHLLRLLYVIRNLAHTICLASIRPLQVLQTSIVQHHRIDASSDTSISTDVATFWILTCITFSIQCPKLGPGSGYRILIIDGAHTICCYSSRKFRKQRTSSRSYRPCRLQVMNSGASAAAHISSYHGRTSFVCARRRLRASDGRTDTFSGARTLASSPNRAAVLS